VDFFNLASELSEDLKAKKLHLITTEVRFEGSFPLEPPLVRIVSPRIDYLKSSKQVLAGGNILFAEGWWKAQPMQEVFEAIRSILNELRLDFESTQPCYTFEEAQASEYRTMLSSGVYPTEQHFSRRLALYSATYMGSSHREGNKICVPTSVLKELSRDGQQLPSPLLLELQAPNGCRTHVGVWEFSAAEGQAVAPDWILQTLKVENGEKVRIRLVNLPRGTFLRLQPFTRKFMAVNDNDRIKVLATLEYQVQQKKKKKKNA
jgi:hypothetical protein